MELTDDLKTVLIETGQTLTGTVRRLYMARSVKMLGYGGAQRAEAELEWNRGTIRKGRHELENGITCIDNFSARGRKRAEEHWTKLEQDIREIVEPQSQTDPSFKTKRLYTRLSAAEVRRQLIEQKGYTEFDVPSRRTVSTKLNDYGFYLRKVAKKSPKRSYPKRMPFLMRSGG
jgi:Rhodopirellula transposase DDE domain